MSFSFTLEILNRQGLIGRGGDRPVALKKPSMSPLVYCIFLSRVLVRRARLVAVPAGEVGQAAFEVRPDLLDGVEFGCVCGQRVDAKPWPGGDEGTHGGGDVPVQVVPDEHDRTTELLMGGVEQGGEVSFTEAPLLTLASFVDHRAVDESTALPGLVAGQAGQRDAAGSLRGDFHDRGLTARAQVRALAGLSVCPASSAKQIHAPNLRATLLSRAIGVFAT